MYEGSIQIRNRKFRLRSNARFAPGRTNASALPFARGGSAFRLDSQPRKFGETWGTHFGAVQSNWLPANNMPDPLYLSLWFSDFSGPAMLPHGMAVLAQFPFSAQRPGVTYFAVQPVSWNEPTVLERRFSPGIAPEEAVTLAADLIHDDYAYIFDAYWDLWTPGETGRQWLRAPSLVKFIVQGEQFDNGTQEQTGQIQVDFGLDSPFLQESVELTNEAEMKVRENVSKLVEFTMKSEKNTRATGRLLWSESEENLAQKLIARLQRVQ
jgi:hypothetical protein